MGVYLVSYPYTPYILPSPPPHGPQAAHHPLRMNPYPSPPGGRRAGEGGESKAKSESERAADVESWTVPTVYGHCRYTEEEGERREALLNRLMNCGSVTDPSEARTKDDRPPHRGKRQKNAYLTL